MNLIYGVWIMVSQNACHVFVWNSKVFHLRFFNHFLFSRISSKDRIPCHTNTVYVGRWSGSWVPTSHVCRGELTAPSLWQPYYLLICESVSRDDSTFLKRQFAKCFNAASASMLNSPSTENKTVEKCKCCWSQVSRYFSSSVSPLPGEPSRGSSVGRREHQCSQHACC